MQEPVKEIDGISYTFDYLEPTKALPLSVLIAKSLLGPAGSLISNLAGALALGKNTAGKISILDVDLSKIQITDACEMLARNIDSKQFMEIAKELLKTVHYSPGAEAEANGSLDLDMDKNFRGKIKHLYKVLAFAMEVNFGDFFDDLTGFARNAKGFLSSLSQRPSPGKSGDPSSGA